MFNLIGTTYGGDGQSTFALPDLRGRIPIHMGNGFTLAETGGVETVTLTVRQIPAHTHTLLASADLATGTAPAGQVFGSLVERGDPAIRHRRSAEDIGDPDGQPGGRQPAAQ